MKGEWGHHSNEVLALCTNVLQPFAPRFYLYNHYYKSYTKDNTEGSVRVDKKAAPIYFFYHAL